MLKGDTADVPCIIQVKQGVLVKISRFDDMPGIELDVQGVGVFTSIRVSRFEPKYINQGEIQS
jgi:hypothetical protein